MFTGLLIKQHYFTIISNVIYTYANFKAFFNDTNMQVGRYVIHVFDTDANKILNMDIIINLTRITL